MYHIVKTFTAAIYCSLREGYDGETHWIGEAIEFCRKYCTGVKLGVNVSPTQFVYVDGNEAGFKVELINYPRFPLTEQEIRDRAFDLASKLKDHFKQERVSIIFPDETIMLGDK